MDKISVGINVGFIKEGDYYVAYCPALNISSYGKTEKEAKSRFEDEIQIFFEETSKKGTLEKYLLKHGWTLTQKPKPKYKPPKQIFSNLGNIQNTFKEQIAIPVCP